MTFGWYDFLLSFFTIFQLFWRLVPPKYTVKTMVFGGFSIFAASMRHSKNHPKMSPKIIKNSEKIMKLWLCFLAFIWLSFCSNLSQFWLHSGSIWDPFWIKKADIFPMTPPGLIFIDFYRFWTSFGEVFGPNLPQIVSNISKFVTFQIKNP